MTDKQQNSDEVDDATLVLRYAERDDGEAIALLFRRHADFAFQTASRYLNNPSEAEDVVQTAFIRVMREARMYRGGAGVKVWIMKIVVNACRAFVKSAVRRRRRETVCFEEAARQAETGGERTREENAEERVESIKAALEQLSPQFRMPIWLHYYEGLPYRDVSQALGVSEDALRTRTRRGLNLLRASLARSGMAVPTAMLLPALRSIPGERVPDRLRRSLDALGRTPRHALPADRLRNAIPVSGHWLAMAAGLAAALGMASLLWWSRSASPTADPVSQFQPGGNILAAWHFDTHDATQGLHVMRGEWRHGPQSGRNGAGGMEIDSDFFLAALPVGPERLPLKVTYRTRATPRQQDKDLGSVVFLSWEPRRLHALINGLGFKREIRSRRAGAWQETVEFVTENAVYMEVDGKPHSLVFLSPLPNSRLLLRARGSFILDELTVRAVAPDEVPDLTRYVEALESVPPEHRKGTVALPQIAPGSAHKEVTATFYD